jgi:hypothetical protein
VGRQQRGGEPDVRVRAKSARALCTSRGDLVMASVGRRGRVRVMRPDRHLSPARRPARSSEAPALCAHGGGVVVAWAARGRFCG